MSETNDQLCWVYEEHSVGAGGCSGRPGSPNETGSLVLRVPCGFKQGTGQRPPIPECILINLYKSKRASVLEFPVIYREGKKSPKADLYQPLRVGPLLTTHGHRLNQRFLTGVL